MYLEMSIRNLPQEIFRHIDEMSSIRDRLGLFDLATLLEAKRKQVGSHYKFWLLKPRYIVRAKLLANEYIEEISIYDNAERRVIYSTTPANGVDMLVQYVNNYNYTSPFSDDYPLGIQYTEFSETVKRLQLDPNDLTMLRKYNYVDPDPRFDDFYDAFLERYFQVLDNAIVFPTELKLYRYDYEGLEANEIYRVIYTLVTKYGYWNEETEFMLGLPPRSPPDLSLQREFSYTLQVDNEIIASYSLTREGKILSMMGDSKYTDPARRFIEGKI